MSTTTARAGFLRGALVGACSALVTAAAHTCGGGGIPTGGAMAVLVAVCVAVGATVGGIRLEGRRVHSALVIAALCVGQVLGHLVLASAGSHASHSAGHSAGHFASLLTAPMLGMHAAAAIGLGLLICVVEYLYVVCASVLCWLRLFVTVPTRATSRIVQRHPRPAVARSVLVRSGLGMRGPPLRSNAAA